MHCELKLARTLLRSNMEEYLLICEAYISKCESISNVDKNGHSEQSKEAERKKEAVIEELQSIKSRVLTV